MTIGQKISVLRNSQNMSQEQLAEIVNVSRQSVSKWEMDQALPQIDKVLMMCNIFSVTADEFLRSDIPVKDTDNKEHIPGRYFGTDGFRGEANVELNSMHAYKVGRFLGWYYASALSGCSKANYRPRIVIGKDTRRSSYMLEYSLVAGITASGADAYMLHVTTTPSVSYVTRLDEFDCGIMITASHNPYYDNGIKIIHRYGEKLDDYTASLIEAYIDGDMSAIGMMTEDLPWAKREKLGCIVDYVSGRNRYVGYLISLASHSYKNLKIGIDCANGASWTIAKAVFDALGAQTYVIGAEPDGTNVNLNCGSTHMENLCSLVQEQHLDVGFAFDGDADRCIAVDENGHIVDGDAMLYILAKRLKSRDMLNNSTVVATVMSNSGFVQSLKNIDVECVQTKVGDRYVYECMQKNDYSLGGEQSGHIIIKKYATTGDGLLTAIMISEEICDAKQKLSRLTEPIKLFPQYTISVPVRDKDAALNDTEVIKEKEKTQELIGGRGRVLLRKSGTEPVIRIMIECEKEDSCRLYAQALAKVIKERGYAID